MLCKISLGRCSRRAQAAQTVCFDPMEFILVIVEEGFLWVFIVGYCLCLPFWKITTDINRSEMIRIISSFWCCWAGRCLAPLFYLIFLFCFIKNLQDFFIRPTFMIDLFCLSTQKWPPFCSSEQLLSEGSILGSTRELLNWEQKNKRLAANLLRNV